MSRFIVRAVFNGTSLELAIPGRSVDNVVKRARRDRTARNATVFLIYNRKTGKLIDTRFN